MSSIISYTQTSECIKKKSRTTAASLANILSPKTIIDLLQLCGGVFLPESLGGETSELPTRPHQNLTVNFSSDKNTLNMCNTILLEKNLQLGWIHTLMPGGLEHLVVVVSTLETFP